MTEPHENIPHQDIPHEDDDEPNNLHPGQHDEGGHGGMATRELDAKEEGGDEQDD